MLTILGLLGEAGALGGAWATIAPWTPFGTIMTLYARVLDPAAWSSSDTESALACAGTSSYSPRPASAGSGGRLAELVAIRCGCGRRPALAISRLKWQVTGGKSGGRSA